jgi:outer membrane protein W
MKTVVAAFALASLVATSAWAKTESPVTVRSGALTFLRADRTSVVARQPSQPYALMLGVAF